MLAVTATAIDAVKVIVPASFGDPRGYFSETYHRARFADCGIDLEFVQENQSSSAAAGTVRGLHFQSQPMAQDKLVRVIKGRIFDVAVDLRRSSPTFGRWVSEELSSENRKQLLVPVGFAHGFCTLEEDTHVLYKVTNYYSPANEIGVAWDDADLGIDWPVTPERVTLSDKDSRMLALRSLPTYFE